MENFDRAQNLLQQFKGDAYLHGLGILNRVGPVTAELGRHAVLVCDRFPGSTEFVTTINESLSSAGVQVLAELKGAAPNAPREDLSQITEGLVACQPDVLVSFGGSTIEPVAVECIRLVVNYLPAVLAVPHDPEGRMALGLATDLGGYCIMLGGTNGAHLTSFSLVDILSHGRACGMLNPYYTVFFAPAIETPLKVVGRIYQQAGYTRADIESFVDSSVFSVQPLILRK